MISKNENLISPPNSDEIHHWQNKLEWLKLDYLDNKINDYILPNHYEYYSGLTSFFLYNIKDIESLNYFNSILVRDGSLTLIKFFHQNPHPKHIKTKLVIHKNLYYLIPLAWKNQTLLYETQSMTQEPKKPEAFFLFGNLDPFHCSKQYLEYKLKSILNKYKIRENNCPIFVTLMANELNNERIIEKENKFLLEFISKTANILGENITYKTWDELRDFDFHNCLYFNLNQYDHLFSDSYVDYHFLSKGAYPIPRTDHQPIQQKVELSPFHFINISNQFPDNYYIIAQKISDEIKFYNNNIFKEEFLLNRKVDYFSDVKICTPELLSYSNHLAKKFHPCSYT